VSGTSGSWVKTKCPDWAKANQYRGKLFEGHKKPQTSEHEGVLKEKREELARVRDEMRRPGLSQGLVRELRKHKRYWNKRSLSSSRPNLPQNKKGRPKKATPLK
jgi:hypothetical protein